MTIARAMQLRRRKVGDSGDRVRRTKEQGATSFKGRQVGVWWFRRERPLETAKLSPGSFCSLRKQEAGLFSESHLSEQMN